MAQLISEIWEGLRAAGMPEVMLYLPDLTASRCHWKDTTLIGETRVALLADQDRQIVRILPVDSCVGIGIASPKGVDPSGYKTVVYGKLASQFGGEVVEPVPEPEPEPVVAVTPPPPPAPEPVPEPTTAARPDPLASRWGSAQKQNPPQGSRVGGLSGSSHGTR